MSNSTVKSSVEEVFTPVWYEDGKWIEWARKVLYGNTEPVSHAPLEHGDVEEDLPF